MECGRAEAARWWKAGDEGAVDAGGGDAGGRSGGVDGNDVV